MDVDAGLLSAKFFEDDPEESEDDLEGDPESFNFSTSALPSAEPCAVPNYTPAPIHQQIREVGIFLNNKRRATAQQTLLGGATAWVDQDDSGTYDPKLERKTPPLRKKAKRRRPAEGLGEDGNSKQRKRKRTTEYAGLITFNFTNQKALDYLRSISPGPFSDNSEESTLGTDGEDDLSGSGAFGRGKRVRQAKKSDEISTREDGLTIDALTIGHPQRRGCKACFQSGNDECTLIDDGQDYPCEACEDAGIDCELIVLPKLKRSCEHCKSKRKQCSYRRNKGKGKTSCSSCNEEGVHCVAGPLPESSRRMDDVLGLTTPERQGRAPPRSPTPSPPPVRPRMYVACNQCRNFGKRCSLKTKNDPGPCSCCRKTSQHCQFVFIPPSQLAAASHSGLRSKYNHKYGGHAPSTPSRSRRQLGDANTPTTRNAIRKEVEEINNKWTNTEAKKQARKNRQIQTRSNSSIAGPKSRHGGPAELIGCTAGIKHIFITTSFCHPIHFNYQPDPMGSEPCSWCDNPLFGIFGLDEGEGPRRVEGFYDPDGNGFEEILGGFAEFGIKNSKMCIPCTFERINMMGCECHQTRKLTPEDCGGWEYNDVKWARAWSAFQAGDMVGAEYLLKSKWCAICPSLAHRRCGSRQDDGGDGCGLLLCDKCDELMGKIMRSGVWEGSRALDAVVREITGVQKWLHPDGVRADAWFLTSKGELCERLKKNFGIKEPGDGAESLPTPPTDSESTFPVPDFALKTGHLGEGKAKELSAEMIADEDDLHMKGDMKAAKPKPVDRKGKGKDMSFFEEEYQSQFTSIPEMQVGVEQTHPRNVAQLHHMKIGSPVQVFRWGTDRKKRGVSSSPEEGHKERGKVTRGGRVEPRREAIAKAFGGTVIDLTDD